jgi:putative tryptophan/tyrosine transport system substrate-binding protein
MRRRVFLRMLGGGAAWPLTAWAQGGRGIRRVGVWMNIANDPEGESRLAAFRQKIGELGWVEGRDVRIDICWSDGSADQARACAAKIVGAAPDVILSSGPEPLAALRDETRTIPVVFVQVGEPVESGVVTSLAHPNRNVTGSSAFEYSIAGKWVELLKQVAPNVTRVGVLRNVAAFTQPGYLTAIEAAASRLGVVVVVHDSGDVTEIASSMDAFARECDGLIVLPSSIAAMHRQAIVEQANRHRLPAVYAYRFYAACGGLLSYGNSVPETYRQAAAQVDQILRGANAGDLPVQMAPKIELIINLKTAKYLDLSIPPMLLARADEVIE